MSTVKGTLEQTACLAEYDTQLGKQLLSCTKSVDAKACCCTSAAFVNAQILHW